MNQHERVRMSEANTPPGIRSCSKTCCVYFLFDLAFRDSGGNIQWNTKVLLERMKCVT